MTTLSGMPSRTALPGLSVVASSSSLKKAIIPGSYSGVCQQFAANIHSIWVLREMDLDQDSWAYALVVAISIWPLGCEVDRLGF